MPRALFAARLLGDDTPNVEGDTVRLSIGPDVEVDVVEFRRVVATFRRAFNHGSAQLHTHLTELECTAALYQEDFARGLSLADCAGFEAWHRNQTESLRADLTWVLTKLVAGYARLDASEPAIQHARRLLALDPYSEAALQLLMRLYASTGQAAAAIRLYERHTRLLAQDLDLLPSPETRHRYGKICNGSFDTALILQEAMTSVPGDSADPLITSWHSGDGRDCTPFVAREPALWQLAGFLGFTLAGNGQIVFVTGEAGSGKTTLIDKFAQHAQTQHPNLIIAAGACTAFAGAGEPFQPFVEILQQLTGVDRFIPRAALTEQMAAFGRWRNIREIQHIVSATRRTANGAKGALTHEEFTAVLQQIAAQRPLLLILDDLQWCDASSVALLYHLARRIEDHSILIIGAYRPEEVSWHTDQAHPLGALVEEDETFRRDIFEHSQGHALFTVELVRQMKVEGQLTWRADGRWVQRKPVNWQMLPPKVEALIARRLHRLAPGLHKILSIASVEGEWFTLEVLAYVLKKAREVLANELITLSEDGHNVIPKPRLLPGVAPVLANHFELAGALERASQYRLLAGKQLVCLPAFAG